MTSDDKILVVNPFGIGDILFTTPLIRAIKDSLPQCRISYWCNERVEEILKNHPLIEHVFALSRGDLKKIFKQSKLNGIRRAIKLVRQLKAEKFSIAFDFSLDHRYTLLLMLLGVKKRIGFDYKGRGRFLTHKITVTGYAEKHVVEYYLDLLKFVDIQPRSKNLEVFFSESHNARAKSILAQAGVSEKDCLIGMACGAGASWGVQAHLKHWPALKFAELADRIIKQQGAKIVLLGDASEEYIADIITAAMKYKAINAIGRTSLGELAAIIRRCNMLVVNDGGPLHIAVGLGVKTVSIFGPVDEKVYGPFPASEKHIVIKNGLSCRPCYIRFKMAACDKDRECITSITTDQVFDVITPHLKG